MLTTKDLRYYYTDKNANKDLSDYCGLIRLDRIFKLELKQEKKFPKDKDKNHFIIHAGNWTKFDKKTKS